MRVGYCGSVLAPRKPRPSSTTFAAVQGTFPSFAEQEAIAEILCDMDTEIAALEAKLAKAQQLKQGIMHELLTGRIRLK
jgi:type I restriction enzyme, S subunit